MIYQLLGKLFHSGYLDRYTPHPIHGVWAMLIMAVGVVTFVRDGWMIFGMTSFMLGAALGFATVLSMLWEKSIQYWQAIADVFEKAGRVTDPIARAEILQSMGYKVIPNQMITIHEVREETKEHGWQKLTHRVPVSPTVMQLIADKVLMSGNTDFIETNFSNIPNFRKVHKELKAKGLLSQKNNKNVRLGYTFNRKGLDTLYEYASEGVKLELRKRS